MSLPMPTSIWIEATNTCNARCPLCPTGNGTLGRPKAFFDVGLYQQIVREVRPQRMNFWNFGEPFLHPDIHSMITYAKNMGVKDTWASTNGYAFYDRALIPALVNCGLDLLIVGLDGTDAETFNRYRVNVQFDRLMSNLRWMQATTPFPGKLIWQFIVMQQNQHQLEAARSMAADLGMEFWVKQANLDMLSGQGDASWLPDDPSYCRYEETIEGVRVKGGGRGKCFFVENTLIINADGSVVPCCFDAQTELLLGNAKAQSIQDIWAGEPLHELRRRIRSERHLYSPCNRCAVGVEVFSEKALHVTAMT